jgi:hypothetical protein
LGKVGCFLFSLFAFFLFFSFVSSFSLLDMEEDPVVALSDLLQRNKDFACAFAAVPNESELLSLWNSLRIRITAESPLLPAVRRIPPRPIGRPSLEYVNAGKSSLWTWPVTKDQNKSGVVLGESAHLKRTKRAFVVDETVKVFRAFLDLLKSINATYVKRFMDARQNFPEDLLNKIFMNLGGLLICAQKCVDDLTEEVNRHAGNLEMINLASWYNRIAKDLMSLFLPFYRGFPAARKLLNRLSNENGDKTPAAVMFRVMQGEVQKKVCV